MKAYKVYSYLGSPKVVMASWSRVRAVQRFSLLTGTEIKLIEKSIIVSNNQEEIKWALANEGIAIKSPNV